VREESRRGAVSALRVAQGTRIILPDRLSPADLVVVGDSIVFGTLAEEREIFTTLMRRDTGWNVLNLGIPSGCPCDYNLMLDAVRREIPPPPRGVFYAIFANDLMEGTCGPARLDRLFIREGAYRRDAGLRLRRARERLFQHSVAYQFLKRMLTFRQLAMGGEPVPYAKDGWTFAFAPTAWWKPLIEPYFSPENRAAVLRNTVEGKRIAQEWGSPFCAVLIPFKEQIYARGVPAAYDPLFDAAYDAVASDLQAAGVPVLDLRPAFRHAAASGQKLFWTLDGHLSTEGHRLVADALLARVREGIESHE
jgi:hypothetical protein